MDDSTVRKLGHLLAAQARVLGMQAENEARKAKGDSPAYDETSFFQEALFMETVLRE